MNNRVLVLVVPIVSLLTITANAQTEYARRQEAARAQAQLQEAQYQHAANIGSQLELKRQIDIFAKRHGGYADAGSCSSATTTTCGPLAFCVPKVRVSVPVAELGNGYTDDIGQCHVTFGDDLACSLTTEVTLGDSWALKTNAMMTLVAKCLDRQNQRKVLYQYEKIPGANRPQFA